MSAEIIVYAIESLVYLVLLLVIAFALRGIRRELKRVADGLEEMEIPE